MLGAPPEWEVQPASTADAAAIRALLRAAYGGRISAEMNGRPLVRPAGPSFVVYDHGEIVAFGGGYAEPWMEAPGRRRLEIAVHPTWRRRGYGKALLDRLLRAARADGLRRVDVRVRADQLAGRRFAERHGFYESEQICELELEVAAAQLTYSPEFDNGAAAAEPQVRFVRYRQLLAEDPDAGREVHRLWCALADLPGVDPATIPPEPALIAWLEQKTVAFDGCFVALVGSYYVGLCIINSRPHYERALFQNLTGVLPAYRRLGIGRALKERAIALTRQLGYERLITLNAPDNREMLALNQALGFQMTGRWATLEHAL